MTILALALLIAAFVLFVIDVVQTRSLVSAGLGCATLAIILTHGVIGL